MARPCKTRRLERLPKAVLYEPLNADAEERTPCEIAIEDFEIVRLVDGHGIHLEAAAAKVGVSRSTAGRMLERCRRAIALGIERRAPLYLDASQNLELDSTSGLRVCPEVSEGMNGLAIAVSEKSPDSQVSRLFGRAEYFIFLDESGSLLDCIENPGTTASRSAARKAVSVLVQAKVSRVVAGRFGSEALEALSAAKIEPFLASGLTARRAQEMFSTK